MRHDETAAPRETWPEYLKVLGNKELTDLAGDSCWLLTERNQPEDQRTDFRRRRKTIIAECERRGIPEAANECRPAAGAMETE